METDEYMCPLSLLYLEGCIGCSLLCASTSKIHYILSIATLCPGVVEGLEFNVGLLSTACQWVSQPHVANWSLEIPLLDIDLSNVLSIASYNVLYGDPIKRCTLILILIKFSNSSLCNRWYDARWKPDYHGVTRVAHLWQGWYCGVHTSDSGLRDNDAWNAV